MSSKQSFFLSIAKAGQVKLGQLSKKEHQWQKVSKGQLLFFLKKKIGPTPASFLFIFVLFKHKFCRKKLQDSNLDRRSRRHARRPLDHHHGSPKGQLLTLASVGDLAVGHMMLCHMMWCPLIGQSAIIYIVAILLSSNMLAAS